MKEAHVVAIEAAVKAVSEMKEINHIYFVACGGSLAFMMPAQYIFDRELDIPASFYPSNEFVYRAPKALGKNSLVLIQAIHLRLLRQPRLQEKREQSQSHYLILKVLLSGMLPSILSTMTGARKQIQVISTKVFCTH